MAGSALAVNCLLPRLGLAAAGSVASPMAAAATPSGQSMAAQSPACKAVSFEECQSLDCRTIAERSAIVQAAWNYLLEETGRISDPSLRGLVMDVYNDPTPRISEMDSVERKHVGNRLKLAGYTSQELDFLPPVFANMRERIPTIAAPGSGYGSHHAYPGGLITHVATNVKITANIVDVYRDVYGYDVNRDIAMAAQLLHDLHKPYVFQWQEDASSRTEQQLAGTGEHHVLSLAELLVRNAPADLVVAQACAHTHPGTEADEAQVVNWLTAASIIADVEPVQYGLLDKSGKTLPMPRRQEGFICHLGDHDFVLSVPAVQWTLPVLREIAMTDYKLSETDLQGKPFNTFRNMVYSNLSAMRLQQAYTQGRENMRALVHSLVQPV
ncbi:MAG: HD domain-containing protein [Planctomycetaceae bacterium]|nr:HD domain-containing protein [Planctomycetaceae bacterium]